MGGNGRKGGRSRNGRMSGIIHSQLRHGRARLQPRFDGLDVDEELGRRCERFSVSCVGPEANGPWHGVNAVRDRNVTFEISVIFIAVKEISFDLAARLNVTARNLFEASLDLLRVFFEVCMDLFRFRDKDSELS